MPNFGLNRIRRGVPRNKVHRPYIKLNEKKNKFPLSISYCCIMLQMYPFLLKTQGF